MVENSIFGVGVEKEIRERERRPHRRKKNRKRKNPPETGIAKRSFVTVTQSHSTSSSQKKIAL